jgi:tRNA dimethylallyltransferase
LEEVIVIVGPTCSGKTKLSMLLSERLDIEIISADSRQIFKLLEIGTAKPNIELLKKVRHYFVDELNPDEYFNASIFAENSEIIIQEIIKKHKIPIVVGGSGLYVKALMDGITESTDTNKELRTTFLELRQKYGNDYLYNELNKVDEVSAKKLLPQNWKRVIRALEVFQLTGKPIWIHHEKNIKLDKFNFKQFGLLWNREVLYKNIDNRVDEIVKLGLVDEVKSILNLGYTKSLNALNTVGYKEIIQYLENEITLDRAIELIKRNTRRYAKRQMTWFNADKRIKWFDIKSENDLIILADKIAKEINERKN